MGGTADTSPLSAVQMRQAPAALEVGGDGTCQHQPSSFSH